MSEGQNWQNNYNMGRNNPGGFGPAPTGSMAQDVKNWGAFNQGKIDAAKNVQHATGSSSSTMISGGGGKSEQMPLWLSASLIVVGAVILYVTKDKFLFGQSYPIFGWGSLGVGVLSLVIRFFRPIVMFITIVVAVAAALQHFFPALFSHIR